MSYFGSTVNQLIGMGLFDAPRLDEKTQERVNTALENARHNGYDYSTSDPELVATDLGTCDADLEGREDLAPYVRVWQQGGVV